MVGHAFKARFGISKLIVYNYAGTYLDTYIIVLKEWHLNYNYAGIDTAKSFLWFDGRSGINNPPAVFTNNIIKLCKGKTMKTINDAKCHNIQLLPQNAFFSIYYPSWQLYFDTGSREVVKKRLNNSSLASHW
ncbi:unnamed protein product [Lepeophtheirus salmonis]|uniref:(salmon louse) hypothetical protein n=1 Tax=Lepeophtheirus salmonis TaxID=72036 RepID=A0A7R8CSR6_LEPSM|nr:unnamed protein product [Lepeophtheirus salmonis]CAF2917405.1 unnamed protein product [Lepeophtheirus salmonis]